MRVFRVILIGLIVIGLAPGTFLRSEVEPVGDRDYVPPHAVPIKAEPTQAGPFALTGAWEIRSDDPRVGGYSALALTAPDELTAISDGGRVLRITLRDGAPVKLDDGSPPTIQRTVGGTFYDAKQNWDVESLTRDPATGTLWAGFEGTNSIERLTRALESQAASRPDVMRDWGANSGPEALARLPDGRFLVFEEGEVGWTGNLHRGVLFDGDPTEGANPVQFSLAIAGGYAPVDATAMPDGRVLVLLRRVLWGLPPGFASAVLMVDPSQISEGATLTGTMLAELPPSIPHDNFEGVALSQEADGQMYLWLVADNNLMQIQRSLLIKLRISERF